MSESTIQVSTDKVIMACDMAIPDCKLKAEAIHNQRVLAMQQVYRGWFWWKRLYTEAEAIEYCKRNHSDSLAAIDYDYWKLTMPYKINKLREFAQCSPGTIMYLSHDDAKLIGEYLREIP